MPPLAEEGDERLLEVARTGLRHGGMELGRRAVEQVLAVGEHQEATTVALRLGEIVGGEDHRRPAARESQNEVPEPLALAGVEPRAGLVEQQYRGTGEEPDGDVDALLVAAGERARLVVATLRE